MFEQMKCLVLKKELNKKKFESSLTAALLWSRLMDL